MPRFRLQYRAIDLDLDKGEFFVGRNPECDLVLDDALVSRRHAVFRLTSDGVEVEDLGSRNGVRVNGAKIAGPTQLKHGDRTRIGSQELVLKDMSSKSDKKKEVTSHTMEIKVCPSCTLPFESSYATCPHCAEDSDAPAKPKAPRIKKRISRSSFTMITDIADKALSMGQYDEAERIMSGILNNLLLDAQRENKLDEYELASSTRHSLRLAAATQKPHWIDIVFELYTATKLLMPSETVDILYDLINTTRYSNTVPLRAYIEQLTELASTYDASQRFLFRRIEGMIRLVSSK